MSRRQRWHPVKGTGNRIYAPWERLLVGALDLPGRLTVGVLRALWPAPPIDPTRVRQVLVLRLDRIGDVFMSLPALADLRSAMPQAHIRLAVGEWSAEAARTAPVDELLIWNAPWVGRKSEGAATLPALLGKAFALRRHGLDLAVDLQGDVRATVLMRVAGARTSVGYANTGGGYLLTHVVPLDETISWVEQNRLAIAMTTGEFARDRTRLDVLTGEERDFARRLFQTLALEGRRPVVAIHPSGGRPVKQWDIVRWTAIAARLQQTFKAAVLVTGSEGDRPLAQKLLKGLPSRGYDLTGRLSLRETLAVIERLDLFLSPDTGPMHMACAADAPAIAVFGPSDPVRYFSGRPPRQVVVRRELWCSPCNLIRKPPAECRGPEAPECLREVSVDAVYLQAARVLTEIGGYRLPS